MQLEVNRSPPATTHSVSPMGKPCSRVAGGRRGGRVPQDPEEGLAVPCLVLLRFAAEDPHPHTAQATPSHPAPTAAAHAHVDACMVDCQEGGRLVRPAVHASHACWAMTAA